MRIQSKVLALLSLFGLLTPMLSQALSPDHAIAWPLDLAAHWQWLYFAGLLLFTGSAVYRDKRWAVLLLATPLPWLTATASAPQADSQSTSVTFAAANVGLGSPDTSRLFEWLATSRTDLIALIEVTPEYALALKGVAGYPHRHVAPRVGPFGLALLSRHPLVESMLMKDGDGIPRIRATVLIDHQPVSITLLHPMPPLSAKYHRSRNDQLRNAADESEPTDRPGIIMGDLNASPWSSGMTGPTDAGFTRATGLEPTWPAVFQGLIGIPIDQILATRHWSVVDSGTGPHIDSDHLPVWATLTLQEATNDQTP